MLVLGQKLDSRVNLYLKTPHGPKKLGTVTVVRYFNREWVRLGFDFTSDVLVLRDEIDPHKPPEPAPA